MQIRSLMTSLVVQNTVVRHEIKNISANNETMQLKLGRDVASYADAFWARHAIFLPHERLLKPRGHSFPFVCLRPDLDSKISWRSHENYFRANRRRLVMQLNANNKLNRLPWGEKYNSNCCILTYGNVNVFKFTMQLFYS